MATRRLRELSRNLKARSGLFDKVSIEKVLPEAVPLCSRCVSMDIEAALVTDLTEFSRSDSILRPLLAFSRIWEDEFSCSLCIFLQKMSPPPEADALGGNLVLYAVSTRVLGCYLQPPEPIFCILNENELNIDDVLTILRLDPRSGDNSLFFTMNEASAEGRWEKNGKEFERVTPVHKVIDSATIDWPMAKRWFKHCRCDSVELRNFKSQARVYDITVIDCHRRVLVTASKNCRYAALSYVYGKQSVESKPGPAPNSLPTNLPLTIEDAIYVTRKLGLRYLWVDKYCIEGRIVWERNKQIGQMDLIYYDAIFTIIAAAGNGPDHGLPGVRETRRKPQHEATIGSHQLLSLPDNPHRTIDLTAWITRGWTYQEAYFSRRHLFFTDYALFCECQCSTMLETCREIRPAWETRFLMSADGPNPHISALAGRLADYSPRKLTYESDTLDAFNGMFRHWRLGESPVYNHFGIPYSPSIDRDLGPGNTFIKGLCWAELSEAVPRKGFSSWSWAGWRAERGVSNSWHYDRYGPGSRWLSDLEINVSVQLADGSISGDAFWGRKFSGRSSAYLHLDCAVVSLSEDFNSREGSTYERLRRIEAQDPENFLASFAPDRFEPERTSPPLCIVIGTPQAGESKFVELFMIVIEWRDFFWERIGCLRLKMNVDSLRPYLHRQKIKLR